MKLSVIIPTGARPEAYALCEKWVKRQTLQPDQIIVVDDGEIPTKITLDATVLRPEKFWRLGDNTQKRNLLIGLEECVGDVIAVVEDDDWISETFLESMLKELLYSTYSYLAVGESNSRYYNLKHKKYKFCKNVSFAPLCQTMFRRELIPHLKKVLSENETKFDSVFWKTLVGPRNLLPASTLCVGMKGMPGRPGLGRGHNCEESEWQKDTDMLDQLQKWIGPDVKYYRNLVG